MNDFTKILRNHKLRPTQQRVSLGKLLFGKGNRHVTAEILKHESDDENLKVSQATVYNVLNDFYNAGLLTKVNIDNDKTCLLYTSPSPRDLSTSRMPSSA